MLDSKYVDRVKPDGGAKVLALAGGGARGLAHIGVIKVLERNGWKPDLITGVSMGAIIGGLYGLHASVEELEEAADLFVRDVLQKRLGLKRMLESEHRINLNWELGEVFLRLITFGWVTRSAGLIPAKTLIKLLQEFFEGKTFADLKIPFLCLASDLYSGRSVVLDSGDLAIAAAASSAIPGIFEPVTIGDRMLIDGGITANVPVPRRNNDTPHWVIAVNVLPSVHREGPFKSSVDVVVRANEIMDVRNNRTYLRWADDIIEPDVRHISMFDFDDLPSLIKKGEEAAEQYLRDLEKEATEYNSFEAKMKRLWNR